MYAIRSYYALLILLALSVWSSASGALSDIYEAYVTNSMDLWKDAMIRMEKEYRTNGNPSILRSLTHCAFMLCPSLDALAIQRRRSLEGEFPRISRITSYNVCYTKLLRIPNVAPGGQAANGAWL